MAETGGEGEGSAPGASARPSVARRTGAAVLRAVDRLWAAPMGFVEALGDTLLMMFQAFWWSVRRPFRARVFVDALDYVGVGSLLIVGLVALFVGMVFALQMVSALRVFRSEGYTGSTVSLSLTVELAPVFTAIMLAARAGSGMATELGSMRITEQIDALTTLSVNPVQYLVSPRVVAATLMAPLMTMLFNFIGMCGCYFVAVTIEGVDRGVFIENTRWFLDSKDILQGLVKAVVFGATFSTIACNQGFNAGGGAKGVGIATTRAVVISFVSIFILDYILSNLWLAVFPRGAR